MVIVVDIWRPTDQTRASRTTSINRKRKQLLITVGCQLAWDGIRRVYVSAASARFCLHRSPDAATQLRQPATDPESSVSSGDVYPGKRESIANGITASSFCDVIDMPQ